MKRDQMRTAIAFAQSPRHRANNFLLLVGINTSIATQNPDNPSILVTSPEPFAIHFCIRDGEQRFASLICVMPITSPSRQKPNVDPERVRLVHDIIDMIP